MFLDFIQGFVGSGDLDLVDFSKILKFTFDHISKTICDMNMIFQE